MYDNFASIVTEEIFIVSVTILLVLPVFLTSISVSLSLSLFASLDGIVPLSFYNKFSNKLTATLMGEGF